MLPENFNTSDRLACGELSRIARGDSLALEQLFQRYGAAILGLLRTLLSGQEQTVEEILQDVFIRVYREAGSYQPAKGKPYSWLATIARRMAIDRLRKNSRRPQFVTIEKEQVENIGDHYLPEILHNGREHLDTALLNQILNELNETQRTALELAYFHGLSHQQIAARMGLPLGTVKSELRRGMIRLKDSYHRCHDR